MSLGRFESEPVPNITIQKNRVQIPGRHFFGSLIASGFLALSPILPNPIYAQEEVQAATIDASVAGASPDAAPDAAPDPEIAEAPIPPLSIESLLMEMGLPDDLRQSFYAPFIASKIGSPLTEDITKAPNFIKKYSYPGNAQDYRFKATPSGEDKIMVEDSKVIYTSATTTELSRSADPYTDKKVFQKFGDPDYTYITPTGSTVYVFLNRGDMGFAITCNPLLHPELFDGKLVDGIDTFLPMTLGEYQNSWQLDKSNPTPSK